MFKMIAIQTINFSRSRIFIKKNFICRKRDNIIFFLYYFRFFRYNGIVLLIARLKRYGGYEKRYAY